MELLRWKARIAVLWVFMAVGMSAVALLSSMAPGKMEEMMAGQIDGMQITDALLVGFAFFWLIPLIMAVLSLTLKDSPNRWANFVLGIIFGVLYLADIIEHSIRGELVAVEVLMGIAGIVVAAFIAWFAWRLPKVAA